ncbi:MAG: ABC transporter ATP-binding protein/permease [Lachnospiraceae bacterium]|nr:ABC transporter ATP-binding protein/permease [Lachnospiraceae bacterium]
MRNVILYAFAMFFLNYLFSFLSSRLRMYKDIKAEMMSNCLADDVRKKVCKMSYEAVNNTSMQERITLAMSLAAHNNFIGILDSIGALVSQVIILFGVMAIVFQYGIIPMLLAFVTVLLQCYIYFKASKKGASYEQDLTLASRYIQYMGPLFLRPSVKKDIKIYKMEDYLFKKFRGYIDQWRMLFEKQKKTNVRYGAITLSLSLVCQFVIYILLGGKVYEGSISVGSFTMGISALNSFMSSTNGIIQSFIDVRQKKVFVEKYNSFMSIPLSNKKAGKDNKVERPKEIEKITFENVSFRYPGSKNNVLNDINFTVHKNEKIAVVGENGAGKTTLILLLMRMYTPTSGRILINDVDINDIDEEDYMDLVSCVSQDFLMLPFSVYENISLDTEKLPKKEEEVWEALREGGLEERISGLYMKLDTPVTKEIDARGIDFSGGEIQRIAIARSLMKNSPIIILDEPTSALDPVAEAKLYDKFNTMTNSKTTFFISHRMASTRFCDKILVLSHGVLAEEGTFEELYEKKGVYYDFYERQARYYDCISKL